MNIILFTSLHGRPGSLNLGQRRVLVPIIVILLILCALLIFSGYWLGHRPAEQTVPVAFDWRSDLQDQRRLLVEARRQTEAGLDALALRVGQLQAQLVRMEALGERLVKMAKLDKGEFDFNQPPAQGGPGQLTAEQASDGSDLLLALDQLAQQLDDRERQLAALESLLLDETLNEQGYPTGRPVERGWLSSGFGRRVDPFTGRKAMHEGVDFAGALGADVVAVAAGVVTWSGVRAGYGNLVEINHGNGYVTRYGHNQANLVKVGETVRQGQVIARMGSSGRSTGPHVHFEVQHHGKLVNPARYLQAKR